ncbi:MAG: hypothetical protein R3C49_25650 [Planctomycetaceae bacterium]
MATGYNIWLGEKTPSATRFERINVVSGHTETSISSAQLLPWRLQVDPLTDHASYRVWVQAVFPFESTTDWSANRDFLKLPDEFQTSLGLSVSPTQDTGSAFIQWGAPSGQVERYELFINEVGHRATPVYHRTDLNSTEHRIEANEALPEGEYEVWVRAFMADGSRSRWGNPAPLTIDIPDVRSAMNFSLFTGSQDSTPEFYWSDPALNYPAPASRYEIYISVEGSSAPVYRRSEIPGETRMYEVDTPLAGNTSYHIWLRVFFTDGSRTGWGQGRTFTLGNVVDDLGHIVPQLTVDGNTASWAAISGAASYELWVNRYGTDGSLLQSRVFHNAALTTTTQTLLLSPGTFRGWLRAMGPGGATQWSPAVNFTV